MKLTTLILPVTLVAAAITIASTLSVEGENDSDHCVNGVNKFGLACDGACEDADRDGEVKREGACESNERRHQGDND